MTKLTPSVQPKRGYEWLGAGWIALVCVVLIVLTLIDGQFTYGEPDGVVITASENPLMFWAGIAFPGVILVAMITIIARGEIQYREDLFEYGRVVEDDE